MTKAEPFIKRLKDTWGTLPRTLKGRELDKVSAVLLGFVNDLEDMDDRTVYICNPHDKRLKVTAQ